MSRNLFILRSSSSSSSSSSNSSSSLMKLTEKHDKNHETDSETHPNTPNIFPYVPKCFELT